MKLTTTPLVLVSIALWPMTVVAQETKPAFSFRDNLLLTILASVFGCVFGAAGSFVASYLKIKGLQKAFDLKIQEIQTQMNLQQSHEKKNQEINLRIRYINPLRFATNQLIS